LNALGEQDAAKANLENARALEKDAEDRLEHGLATTPDVLEAKAARAHADYALANVIGEQEVAQGDLATALSLPARTIIQVQGLDKIATPHSLSVSADDLINRAFDQRPDLQVKVAQLREAEAALEKAHSAYLPTLSIGGAAAGKQRAYGQQNDLPGTYATAPHFWSVELKLKWTIFDGGKRESELAATKAERSRAQAEIDAVRDRISDEVWKAYSDTKTALQRQDAAAAQLSAAGESYASALRAYDLGVRNLLDVLAAQRELAEARTEDITARTQVLSAEAALAFGTADLLAPSAVIPIQQGVTP
jgi:outer membrane protein